ncbi:MAG: hypothetical protein WC675_04630 [Patescibacteria group bacterium]|jgi:hypothetical protein
MDTGVQVRTSVTFAAFAKRPGDGAMITIIQQRAEWDPEKKGPQSFAGAWQPAAHGRTENINEALRREISEELGDSFAQQVEQACVISLEGQTAPEERVFHFIALMPYQALSDISLHEGAAKLCEITEEETQAILTLEREHRSGVDSAGPIHMFPDDKRTLLEGFKRFRTES